MKRKAKRVEAVRAWGWTYMGVLQGDAVEERKNRWQDAEKTVRVIVIRESDWREIQKQLKQWAAK
jgi:hypothetical protein